jgi:polysaccharide biosynthesis protein PslG
MSRAMSRRLRRYGIVTVIAVAPIAILCAYVANLLVPTSPLPRPATYSYVPTASIIESNETIGIADSDVYGLSLPNGALDKAAVDAHFDAIKALGVTTVRVLVPWAGVQPLDPATSSYRDWSRVDYIVKAAADRGMSVLGVLNATPYYGGANGGCWGCVGVAPDPAKFAAFAAEAAGHLRGLVSAYEIWNEPNYNGNWSPAVDPVAYTKLLQAAYSKIKTLGTITVGGVQVPAGDPNATVVAGVLGAVLTVGNVLMDPRTFVQTMYANGAKGFFDALSFHPYSYQQQFGAGLGCQFCQNTPITMLLQIRQTMLNYFDGDTKIWASEYGLGTSLKTYQQQADWIKNFLTTWAEGPTGTVPDQFKELVAEWDDWIGPAFIYTLRDRLGQEGTESGSLGLFYFDEVSGQWKMKCGDEGDSKTCAAQIIKDLIAQRTSNDLAAALAASLQKLVQQVATAVQTAVQTTVIPQVTQTVQKIGSQIGNALAAALAAWAASFKKTPTTTTLVAAVESVDSTAIAQTAVAESFDASAAPEDTAASGVSSAATEKLTAAEEPAAEEVSATGGATEAASTGHAGAALGSSATTTEGSTATTSEDPKAATPEETSTETPPADESTETPAAEDPKTSDESAVSNEQKTTDDSKATAPANRKDEDEVSGDPKKDNDKKSDGDKDADGATATGKHAKGAVKDGTSVDEIKTKLGEETVKTGTPKHAASEDASATTASTAG